MVADHVVVDDFDLALEGKSPQAIEGDFRLDRNEDLERDRRILFDLEIHELAGDVKRICRKHDVEAKYGVTDWAGLDPIIRDIVVDLRYRGDYTGGTREKVQPCVVGNDLEKLAELMSNELYWVRQRGVPNDRFQRRKKYVP